MKAIGYIRVSTDKQARDGESLEAQKARIEAYCEENKFALLKVYHDQESGGKSKARGGYMELLGCIKEDGFDVLVVNDTDRLSRDSMSLLILEYILRQAGIEFHGVTGRINTVDPDGFMMFGIKSLVGESERRRIAKKTTEVLQHKRQSGLATSRPPYGYQRKNVKRGGESVAVFVEVPEEQEVISLINRLYHEDGVAPAEIARRINDHGFTKRNGKRWDNKQVTRLIEDYNRVYNTTSAVVDKGIEFLKALP